MAHLHGSSSAGPSGRSLTAALLLCLTAVLSLVPGGVRGAALNPDDFLTKRFSNTTLTSDVPYATVEQTTYPSTSHTTVTLGLDIYQPSGDLTTGRPVIVWIHGGGFRQDSTKTQSYIVNYAKEFARRGYVSIAIEYRRRFRTGDGHADADVAGTPEWAALQDATRDARSALDWIRANAATYRIDPNLIFVAGGSAGGRITQTVSQFPGPDLDALYAPDTTLATAWNRAGMIANATLWGAPEIPMRGWSYPYLTAARSAQITPTLIVHGTADTTIDPQNARDLDTAIRAANGTSELHLISGAGHTPTKYDSSIIPWIAEFFVAQWKLRLSSPTPTTTPSPSPTPGATLTGSPTPTPTAGKLAIAEVYPGGGKTGAPYTNDFIVLVNTGSASVSLNGLSLQHLKAGVWQTPFALPNVSIPVGGFYLVKAYNDGTSIGGALPTPYATTPQDKSWNLSTSSGAAVALVSGVSKLSGCTGPTILDLVGFFSTSGNCYETGVAPGGSATQSIRRSSPYLDTNNNATDFSLGSPTPRTSP